MRRVLRENKWKVSLTTAGPPAQTIEKVLDAPSQDVAVRRAIQAFPGMTFTQVMAAALDQQTPPGQAPVLPQQQLPKQLAQLKPLQPLTPPGQQQQQQREAVDPGAIRYPYSITLPARFGRILHETAAVPIVQRNGQHRIILITENEMRGFLQRLRAHPDREAAVIIFNGIRSSV